MNLALSSALLNASEGVVAGSPFLPAGLFNATPWSAGAAGAGANGSEVGEVPQVPAYIRTASTVACVIIMSLGVAGNAMVPAVILRSRDMRNSTNIFLVNLSVADLLVLLVCTPTVLVEVHSRPEVWLLGETMCKAVPFVELTVAHASVLTILAISFERYYAICEPLRAGYVCTKARALLICLLAWALAALLTSPVILVAEYSMEEYFDGSLVPVCFSMVDSFWPAFFFLATVAVFFLLPLVILVVLYSVIARHLMANPRIMSVHQQLHYRYRKQVVLMLGTVVAAFFVCLLPFRAFTVWIIAAPPETVVSIGYENHYGLLCLCRVMHYLNSAVNPILYNLMSSKFRDGFSRLCCGCRWAGGPLGRRGTGLSSSATATATATTVRSSAGEPLWRRPARGSSSSSRAGRGRCRRAERRLLQHIARECSVSVHNGVCVVSAARAKDVSYL